MRGDADWYDYNLYWTCDLRQHGRGREGADLRDGA